jgi:hypothetical protein
VIVFSIIRRFILQRVKNVLENKIKYTSFFKTDQLNVGLRWLPFFYAITIMINVFSILLSAPPRLFDFFFRSNMLLLIFIDLVLYFDRIPLWGKFITTLLVGLLVAVSVTFIVKPRLKKSIQGLKKLEYLSGKKRICF